MTMSVIGTLISVFYATAAEHNQRTFHDPLVADPLGTFSPQNCLVCSYLRDAHKGILTLIEAQEAAKESHESDARSVEANGLHRRAD